MVNYSHAPLDFTFAALADPTRRAIVQRLAAGSATVKELAKPFHVHTNQRQFHVIHYPIFFR